MHKCSVKGCGTEAFRRGGKGPWPQRCEVHAKTHEAERQRALYRKRVAAKPPRGPGVCIDCGGEVTPGKRGGIARRCTDCAEAYRQWRDIERGRAVPPPPCSVCGETVTRPSGKGRWPTKCEKHAPPSRAGKVVAPTVVKCSEPDCPNEFERIPNQRGSKRCDECKNALRRARYREKVERDAEAHREQERWYRMRSKFGLEREDYERMLAEQGGVCPCGAPPESQRYGILLVDHDRSCCPGQSSCGRCVRGLLCNDCNVALGIAKDDPDRLRTMASYLEGHSPRIITPADPL